jgi:tRNA (guanine-N7-)-methyltransferase
MPVDVDPDIPAAPSLVLDLAELAKPLDWDAVFGRRAPVEIEVGVGSGYFLSRYAAQHSQINLFGIEIIGTEVQRAADKCRRAGLTNVRLLRVDAPYFLEDYPAAGSVRAAHVYYSDPWPKTRHHKRRLWTPRFRAILERLLQPGGYVFLKTDVTDYFRVIDRVMKESTVLELVDERRLDEQDMPGDITTNFQRKAIEAGHPLHYQQWRKRSQG